MPVIGIPVKQLRALLGVEASPADLLQYLGHLGCDVEGYTQLERVRCRVCGTVYEMTATEEIPPSCSECGADLRANNEPLAPLEVIRMELLAVRPDMFDPGGLARVLRGYLGVEVGRPRYEVGPPAAEVRVDPAMRRPESYRPEIACAVIGNLALDGDGLKIVMKLQENLHWAIGRDRKQASIGVYDFDRVAPEIVYGPQDPDRFKFTPLGAPAVDPGQAMTLREILERHPKGTAYAHLLRGLARFPILSDRNGQVLSMPPIINSEETKVTPETKRFLIDVTGLGRRVVDRTLNITVSSILESFPGSRAYSVRVREGDTERQTPDFTPQNVDLDPVATARILGIAISPQEIVSALGRMRHDATLLPSGQARVQVAAYRNDILHPIDLVEDVAIAYGYHRIAPTLVPTFTVGQERPIESLSERARGLMCGLGFLEVVTLVLTQPEMHDRWVGRDPGDDVVRIANPVSQEQTMVRTSLLPGLVATFQHNLTHPLPQRIFEVGDATLIDAAAETGARDVRRLACGIIGPHTGFEEMKAVAEAVLREFGIGARWRAIDAPPFLGGRAAEAWSPGASGETRLLAFGEVHPEVLERCGLQNPVVLLEGDLSNLEEAGGCPLPNVRER